MARYMCFDIGGTTIKYGLVDDAGIIEERGTFETVGENAEAMLTALARHTEQFRAERALAGIGIAAPGIVRADGYMVTGGALTGLFAYPLAENLAKRTQLPVRVENDANAAALAERWLGNAQNCDNYLMVVLGTGVGGGIVINGDIYRGSHGMAGEFGWNLIHNIDPVCPLESFSLNHHAAVIEGLVDRYDASMRQVDEEVPQIRDAKQIFRLANNGLQEAQEAVNDWARDVAVMIINLFANFDPELILVGGGVSANSAIMKRLQTTIDTMITRHGSLNAIRKTALGQVRPARLQNDAGLIGACYVIKKQLEDG